MYLYGLNNPINMIDSLGAESTWIKNVIIGVVAVAAVGAIIAITGGAAAPIIAGAVVGSISNACVNVGVQYATKGEVDWQEVYISGCTGLVSGALGGSSAPLTAQITGNAMLGTASTVAGDVISETPSSVTTYVYNTVWGGVSGAVGGSGAQNRFQQGSTTGNRVLRTSSNHSHFSDQLNNKNIARSIRNATIRSGVVSGVSSTIASVLGLSNSQVETYKALGLLG